MSDFIYAAKPFKKGGLSEEIKKIYHDNVPPVQEFHGEWGALAVSDNLYRGFQPYESDTHVLAILGGASLCFRDNSFLSSKDSTAGTRAILERWISGKMRWDEDLSGPFSVLIIDKTSGDATCITDLMSFIPIYSLKDQNDLLLSSHVDVLARAANQQDKLDLVSQTDFLFNGYVTYPFTSYTNIRQLAPASIHCVVVEEKEVSSVAYWVPSENKVYKSIDQASKDLRHGIKDYIGSLTTEMSKVAQFLSGGEDSRIIAALLPGEPDAFIFLDLMNREGRIAQRAAKIYGAKFKLRTRSEIRYLDILPASTDLIGSGTEYKQVHTFGFHKSCNLKTYDAVFGGLLADSLFKGLHLIKKRPTKLGREVRGHNFTRAKTLNIGIVSPEFRKELKERRLKHLDYVKTFRHESCEEWFNLWPSSMNQSLGNLHGNRRLFRSYEPFLCKDSVKISAMVPQKWKLNRRMFRNFAIPFLSPSMWLMHSSGRLPYFPWYFNRFIRSIILRVRQINERKDINQRPWSQWSLLHNRPKWSKAIKEYAGGIEKLKPVFEEKDVYEIFKSDSLSIDQKTNLMQLLYIHHKS